VHPSPTVSLLGGKTVKPPEQYDYAVFAPAAEEASRTLSGVPFLRRDIPAASAWAGNFVVVPPVAAASATAIHSWRPDPGAPSARKPGEKVGELRLVHEDGRTDVHPLVATPTAATPA